MSSLKKLVLTVCILALVFALIGTVKVHASDDEMETFFDSQLPYIGIQVNATAQTQPTNNLTVIVDLETEGDVGIEHFNLEVSGFLNGTAKVSMLNITDNNFFLNNTSTEYMNSTYVPNSVWGITFGEITLTYNASVEGLVLTFPNVVNGFPMTQVENTYLEELEKQNTYLQANVTSLNESYQQLTNRFQNLTNTFEQLNQTYVELYQNYTSIKGSVGNLDNTQRVATVLAVTTIIFLITTVYLVMRRPKESW
jgi:uncharacterized membrane-anchored protein YhcB (DUF1043 family)